MKTQDQITVNTILKLLIKHYGWNRVEDELEKIYEETYNQQV